MAGIVEVIVLSDSDEDISTTNAQTKNLEDQKKQSQPVITGASESIRSAVKINEPMVLTSFPPDKRKDGPSFVSLNIGSSKTGENQKLNLVRKDPIIKSAQEYLTVAQKLQKEMGIFSLKDGIKCSAVVGVNGIAVEEKRRSKSSSSSTSSSLSSVARWIGPPERSLSKKVISPVTVLNVPDSSPNQSLRLNTIIFECSERARMRAEVGTRDGEKNPVVELFQLCRKHAKDKTDNDILEKMWTRVVKCEPTYTKSQSFQDFTWGVHKKISNEPKNMHVFLKEFFDEVKRAKAKKTVAVVQQSAVSSTTFDQSPDFKSRQKCSSSMRNCDRNLPLNGLGKASARISTCFRGSGDEGIRPSTSSQSKDAVHEIRIQQLEKMLAKCHKKIRKYEEKEMTLDDLDDEESHHLLVERYKKRSIEIWQKLCEITGCSSKTGRVVEKKFVYEESRYPDVNKQISRLINRSKSFPDYADICNVVKAVNDAKQLRLTRADMDELSLDIFKVVGRELKRRRVLDYEEHFGIPISDIDLLDNDPAERDEQLHIALEQNKKFGTKKCNDVFDAFLAKQEHLESQGLLPMGNEDQMSESDDEGQSLKSDGDSSSNKDKDSSSDSESVAVIDLGDETDSDESTSDLDVQPGGENDEEDTNSGDDIADKDSVDVGGREQQTDRQDNCVKENPPSQTTVIGCSTWDTQLHPKTFQEALDSAAAVPARSTLLVKRKTLSEIDSQPPNRKRALDNNNSVILQPLENSFNENTYNEFETYVQHRLKTATEKRNYDEEIVIIN